MQNISQKIIGAEHLSEVIAFLKNADKFIRQGEVQRALDEILYAREKNPTIMYARAYEEYVRSVLLNQSDSVDQEGDTEKKESGIQKLMPILERILDLAIKEVKRSAMTAYKQKEVMALQKQTAESLEQEAQLRAVSITKKISEYLKRARELEMHNDFHNALNEVARAFILDPADDRILQIEEEIKISQDRFNKKVDTARLDEQKNEEKRREVLFEKWNRQREQEKLLEGQKKKEAYKQARVQKIREYMNGARTLFAEQKLDEALSQLAFLMVLDPLNEDVLSLNWKIREAQSKKSEEHIVQKKKQHEEEKKKEESIQSAVQKSLKKAEAFLQKKKYGDALRVITQAYFIDPSNEEGIALEKKIMAEEEKELQSEEERRSRNEAELRQHQEAELHRLAIEQLKREQLRDHLESEAKLLKNEEEVLLFLSKARGYLTKGDIDNALKQIAKAFKINPFDDDIITMQREILEVQKKTKLLHKTAINIVVEPEHVNDKTIQRTTNKHMEKATKLSGKQKFQDAMDELAQAFRLDPMNEALFALEGEIQQEYIKYEEELRRNEESSKQNQGIKKSLAMAREALSRQSYAEAFGWVDYAMSFDMNRSETIQMREEIDRTQRKDIEQLANEEKESAIQNHVLAATEFISTNQTMEALLEVDLALRLNPKHKEALLLKKKLGKKIVTTTQSGTIL